MLAPVVVEELLAEGAGVPDGAEGLGEAEVRLDLRLRSRGQAQAAGMAR